MTFTMMRWDLSRTCPLKRLVLVMSCIAPAAWAQAAVIEAAPAVEPTLEQTQDHLKEALKKEEPVTKLSPVTVRDRADEGEGILLDRFDLKGMPSLTGTVTDALRGQSSIGFDNSSRWLENGAQVAAPLVSIRGSRPYENNYSINGMDNNNSLNPGGWYDQAEDNWHGDPKGDTANFMLQTDLLESVDVYTDNVPVEYGDFTGGVVNTKLRSARTDGWHGSVGVTHTDADWGRQIRIGDDGEPVPKREFKRTRYHASIEGPIGSTGLGALFAFSRHESRQPVYVPQRGTEDEVKEYTRQRNDNVMLRVNTVANEDFTVGATLLWAPYEAQGYQPMETLDGEYKIKGGGWSLMLDAQKKTGYGTWTFDLARSHNQVSRDAKHNHYLWWLKNPSNTPSKYADWKTHMDFMGKLWAVEGGLGDSRRTQDLTNARVKLVMKPVKLGISKHDIQVGLDAKYRDLQLDREQAYYYKREKTHIMKSARPLTPNVVGAKEDGILAGEQFARHRRVTVGETIDKRAVSLALYGQDTIEIERVTVRPGLRLSWDSVSHNTDLSPRLFADVDVFNNDVFHINGGVSRYYGSQILGNYFAVSARSYYEIRNAHHERKWLVMEDLAPDGVPEAWRYDDQEEDTARVSRRYGALKTPYSDEFTLGVATNWGDAFHASLVGVKRDYKKQLITEWVDDPAGVYDSIVTNKGRSQYRGLTLTVNGTFDAGVLGVHTGTLGLTHSRVKGNQTGNWVASWEDPNGDFIDQHRVILDGAEIDADKVPASNFNPAWVLTFDHRASFWHDRLRFDALWRMQGASKQIVQDPDRPYVDGKLNLQTWHLKRSWEMDFNTAVDVYKRKDIAVTLNLQVMNLFNRTAKRYAHSSTSYSGLRPVYLMGRQYYVGLSAKF